MTTTTGQDCVDCGDAIGGGDDLRDQIWLHQSKMHLELLLYKRKPPWSSHEEGGVSDSTGGGDDLTATASEGLGGDDGVEDLELDVSDRLVAQGTFSRSPLET